MKDPISILTFVAVLGCGLVAGIFLAFSNFVMKALASVPPASGIASMQSINVKVLNRWFFAVFFGTAGCCLVLVVASLLHGQRPGAAYLLVASLLYFVGTVLVTIICNVPLNDSLAAVAPTTADAAPTWSNYLKTWTVWNHVRTVALQQRPCSLWLFVALARQLTLHDPKCYRQRSRQRYLLNRRIGRVSSRSNLMPAISTELWRCTNRKPDS